MGLRSFRFISGFIGFSFFFLMGTASPRAEETNFKGEIGAKKNASGFFDLVVQVWTSSKSDSRLIQTIQIPKVLVQNGKFEITLDMGLKAEIPVYFRAQSRAFESATAFEPVDLKVQSKG